MKRNEASIWSKRSLQAARLLALVSLSSSARADEIALWNFNDATPFVVDRGVGTLATTANPEDVGTPSSPPGTTLNARMGDPAGRALWIHNGHLNRNNGSILELRASTVGFNEVRLSWGGIEPNGDSVMLRCCTASTEPPLQILVDSSH
jgi:hypothetical protein